jgi:hypothetical protein
MSIPADVSTFVLHSSFIVGIYFKTCPDEHVASLISCTKIFLPKPLNLRHVIIKVPAWILDMKLVHPDVILSSLRLETDAMVGV